MATAQATTFTKYAPWLRAPMQVFSHGEWWSYLGMQAPQVAALQCTERIGRRRWVGGRQLQQGQVGAGLQNHLFLIRT